MSHSRIVIVTVVVATIAVGMVWYRIGFQYPEVKIADLLAQGARFVSRTQAVKPPPVGRGVYRL